MSTTKRTAHVAASLLLPIISGLGWAEEEKSDPKSGQSAVSTAPASSATPAGTAATLEYGPHPVGFALLKSVDSSRSFPSAEGPGFRGRPMRIYTWYPALSNGWPLQTVGDFVRMAGDDFRLSGGRDASRGTDNRLPVQLVKGLDEVQLSALLRRPLRSINGAEAAQGPFPLLLIGQGLYYESPLSQVYLCEYLASRGYVVATCPLLGTQYRLVNRNVEDLETEVRDIEYVLSTVHSRPDADPHQLGIIGYDLGGMAGLILAMRNTDVDAFLSLDAGILFPNELGLPDNHPDYRVDRFRIPWMHMTQARFVDAGREDKSLSFLSDRKRFGDSWIISVPTDCHGQFSSYAKFGIRRAVPGYWGPIADSVEVLHDAMCRLAGDFFDAVLKQVPAAADRLRAAASGADRDLHSVEYKKGAPPAASPRLLIHMITEKGLAEARPVIDRIKSADPTAKVLDEAELNWLGYHFLLWWGREAEALDLFRLNVELNPGSADAYVGLGEACLVLDRTDEAVAAFRKALELKPDFPEVKNLLERLTEQK
ncbi:MAG: tetratricopeptide repeat protein [Acidobacteriota bacterium]